ncbi:MAG: hypothetical protein CMF61_02245 [Magnetococcales bacterium]|nr:hypothetical protein [Magnetococcales bacterium]
MLNLTKKLKLTEMQMRVIRATIHGAPAADEDLLEETTEKAAQLLNIPYEDAEKVLVRQINAELDRQNESTQTRWQHAVNNGDNTVIHDETILD